MQPDDIRFAGTWLFLGFPGVGKTTLLLKKLGYDPDSRKFTGDKIVLIISYSSDDMSIQAIPMVEASRLKYLKQGGGIYRVNVESNTFVEILKYIRKYFKNGHIILDDCTDEIGYNPNSEIRQAIRSVRHNGNDLYFLHQHPNDVAPFVYGLSFYIGVFKCALRKLNKTVFEKLPREDEFVKAYEWVQNERTPVRDYAFLYLDPKNPNSYKPFTKVNNTKP